MIAAAVLALLVLPLVVLRGRTLLACYGVHAATWLFAWLISRRLPPLHDDHLYLACVAVAAIQLAALALFVANGSGVRWSANRAALLAAVVYALVIPSMLRAPIDGDEPYYLLQTASLVRDFDLDLKNQYATRAGTAWGRPDLAPQFGDPVGAEGQQYSRHEPFLALLMIPGYLVAGLHGAVATIALFGVLLVRSTIRWMEDEGVDDAAIRAVFPFFALAPPVLFYATRIWPEVPAAFFFVETLRGLREHRLKRWVPAMLGLVMLKLRFVLVAMGMVASGGWRVARWSFAIILIIPLIVIWFLTGDPTNVHTWRELIPTSPMQYVRGFCGLLADGMSGMAFQAPFYLFALVAVVRWKSMPRGFRAGVLASLLYLFYLVPRTEWFGGWAPPLRYLVFLMPVLALGAAAAWSRISRGALAVASAITIALVIHGVAYPWRLFHLFNGENAAGEWLSELYDSDFSRFFPSFIRPNDAAWWGLAGVLLFVFALRRFEIPAAALAIALAVHFGRQPGRTIHFEDAHVVHDGGGKLYPDEYTLMRAAYRGGWILEAGDSLSFLAAEGTYTLHFITGLGATFEMADRAYTVGPDERYQTVVVVVPRSGRVTLRCVAGAINVDRMDGHD